MSHSGGGTFGREPKGDGIGATLTRMPIGADSTFAGRPGAVGDPPRVIVVSSEQPGSRMAGPAVRATAWARELAATGADVVLAVPQEPDVDLGVPTVVFGEPSARRFRRLASDSDVVITQPQRVDVAVGLHRGGARIVYDLYVPSFVEYPASQLAAGYGDRRVRRLIERNQREYAAAVDCGDGFLVASQRQKDFLWGALGQAGRLQAPPSAHEEGQPEVVVAPFGLPPKHPAGPMASPLRGVLVPQEAFIALWAGGIWNWFDPGTLIEGVAMARQRDPRVTLVFLASAHPSDAFIGQDAAAAALRTPLARQLVAEGGIVFADSWVPYDQRWGFLRDADVGVCAHYSSPETRMSFRTRFLDHLWAGLPTITTEGGVLSDAICAADAGICLPAGDAGVWADALVRLAADSSARNSMAAAAWDLGGDYTWPRVAQPIVGLVERLARGDAGPRRRPSATQVVAYLAVALENRLR